MINDIHKFEGSNLSEVWVSAFKMFHELRGDHNITLITTIKDFKEGENIENIKIKEIVNRYLEKYGEQSIENNAFTIFPISYWNKKEDRQLLFSRYEKNIKRFKKFSLNKHGLYFERMIRFEKNGSYFNQLEHIINTWKNYTHRFSALQAGIFDPSKDHNNKPMQGFPCLQQVAFSPIGSNGRFGLNVIGFYAKQYIFERAYGNYLGLYRLGQFMAQEMGIPFTQVTCITAKAEIGEHSKRDLLPLLNELI